MKRRICLTCLSPISSFPQPYESNRKFYMIFLLCDSPLYGKGFSQQFSTRTIFRLISLLSTNCRQHTVWDSNYSFSSRVIYSLSKRTDQDDKLGTSKLVIQANKQLTKTCIIVTVIFLLFLGKDFSYSGHVSILHDKILPSYHRNTLPSMRNHAIYYFLITN